MTGDIAPSVLESHDRFLSDSLAPQRWPRFLTLPERCPPILLFPLVVILSSIKYSSITQL